MRSFVCLLWFLQEKKCSFYTYLFCCTEMRWLFISSSAIWVTSSNTGSVASRARTKTDYVVQNVIELEFELSRMYMKQPMVCKNCCRLSSRLIHLQHLKIWHSVISSNFSVWQFWKVVSSSTIEIVDSPLDQFICNIWNSDILTYTANVLSAEFTDECLQTKSKDNCDFNRWKSVSKIFCFHAISTDICLLF